MATINDLLKDIDDVLTNENVETEKKEPDENQNLINEIDAVISPSPVTIDPDPASSPVPSVPVSPVVKEEKFPAPVPSRLPAPVAKAQEPEIDLTKPANQVLAVIGDKDEDNFNDEDRQLVSTLTTGKDLFDFSKQRPDIMLDDNQKRMVFDYQRESSDYKIPKNSEDWYNLGSAIVEDVDSLRDVTADLFGSALEGGTKALARGIPYLMGSTSTYAKALDAKELLPPEKQAEVEAWRKRAWQIANTPLKGGEKPNPNAYTDQRYYEKIKEFLPKTQVEQLDEKFETKQYEAKQVPFSTTSELIALPEYLAFLSTKLGSGGMQLWDDASEKFGLQDKEKSFERWKSRNEVDTIQAKWLKAEPRAYARVVQTFYAPAMKSFFDLMHPSVDDYMIANPELSREEAKSKREAQIENDVIDTVQEIKDTIPETDPDMEIFGSLTIPGGFGLDAFGYVYNVVSAAKQLTPIARLKLKKLRYTDNQINDLEKKAQQVLKDKELKKLQGFEKPGLIERGAGATATGIEKTGQFLERSPTFSAISRYTPIVTGAALGYEFDPENPLRGMVMGGIAGQAGKTMLELPKVVKEISAAKRISAGGTQGPLATLKTIAQQQDEVKTLTAKLKTYAEGTDEYIETQKMLNDAKERVKGIKAGGQDVIDYQGIGKVSDTTKRILRFVNDDMVANIGEYARLGVEPTLVALATGAIDSSDEEELQTMIGQGLIFSLGGRGVQQTFNKFIGEDPVIAARRSRQANVDALKAYRDSTPETRSQIDQLTDWENVLNRQTKKIEETKVALQDLKTKGADQGEITKLEKTLSAEEKSLSLLKTANAQTRNEFGRQFLQQFGRNNALLNGTLKAGQNNIGFHILSSQQIFDHFRKNPAYQDIPDEVILLYASQSGFYSTGAQGSSDLAFDPAKPSIVINSDGLRSRMEVYGETPIDALNHETGHHITRVPEIQEALGEVKKILFTNEIKDASGLTKTITNGLYTNDQLVDLYESQYLKNRSKQEKEDIAKALGLWDYNAGSLDKDKIKNYMQEEILAEVFSNTLSRNLGKNIDDKQVHLLDFARLKLKNNLLKKAATKILGLGLSGDIESVVTGAQITPEAQSAARNALRLMQSINGDFSTMSTQPDAPLITKADIRKSKVAAERYGMDSGLFATKTVAQVFDAAGKPLGDPIDINDPSVFEGSWRFDQTGEVRLTGYGQIPVALRQLQVPQGGTLSISKQILTDVDGETPKLLNPKELKKLALDRASLFKQAIDTPDYGTPGRFEPVYEGSETYRGSFTPLQMKAVQELPEGIVPLKIKKYLLDLNDAVVRKDGTRFFVDYAAVMDDKGNYKAFSPKIYDIVPIGLQLSKAGNFLVTTISVGRMRDKLNLWADRMPGRLSPWNGSKEAFWQDFSKKYLANWSAGIEGSGYNKRGEPQGSNQLDSNVQKAEEMKSIFNDFLNLFNEDTRSFNLDRTNIPKRKGDPKNKSPDRTIMSMRIDHIAELLSAEHLSKLPVDYGNAIINFLPSEGEAPSSESKAKVPAMPKTQFMPAEAPSGERGFQSKLQLEIQKKFKGANATPEQLKAVLGNPQNVKPEEVKWSGVMDEIDRLAQENNNKVPMQALLNYLRDQGQVKFEEKIIGSGYQNSEKIASKYGISIDGEYGEMSFWDENGDYIDYDDLPKELQNSLGNEMPPKYAQYQLPGGENYREVVLSMPSDLSRSQAKIDAINKRRKEILDISKEQDLFKRSKTDPEAKALNDSLGAEFVELGKQADQLNADIRDGKTGEQYTSSHFSEVPNYIAHMRLNERTDDEGNPGLFVEEFQSDRHQQGREKGYENELPSGYKVIENPQLNDPLGGTAKFFVVDQDGKTVGFGDTPKEAQDFFTSRNAGIPDAPFRKDWGVQLFKRALRDAVESGKSWVGWTTGIEQVKRYENAMRQMVDEIIWKKPKGYQRTFAATKNGGTVVTGTINNDGIVYDSSIPDANGKQLSEVVGKEIAARILTEDSGTVAGNDLTVGGEGMKGFYDTILPKEIGKYVAKMGGKVEKSEIDAGLNYRGSEPMPSRPKYVKMSDYGWTLQLEDRSDWGAWNEKESAEKALQKWQDRWDKKEQTPIWRVNITPEMANIVSAGQIQFMPAESEMIQSKGRVIFEEGVYDSQGNQQYVDRVYGTGGSIEWDAQEKPYPRIRWAGTIKEGFGKTLYLEALNKVKELGQKGLKSDPVTNEDEGIIGPTPRATGVQQSLEKRGLITITEANDGSRLLEITPKGEEFLQKTSPDIRFMPADSEYLDLAQDPKKNRDQLQKMVDEAAKAAGYDVKGWHGTNAEFDVFKPSKYGANGPGIYFSSDQNAANFGRRQISAWIKSPRIAGYEIIADSSNQVKSAEPVTYDDAGNVIPLSQRFQTTSPDIRFMPPEQSPEGMQGVEPPKLYPRTTEMIRPLQGVEPPVRGQVEEPTLSGLAMPAQEPVKIPEVQKEKNIVRIGQMQFMPADEIPTAKKVLKKPLENLPLSEASTWTEIQEAPIITLKDLVGKKVFPTFADITSAGRVFKGIDSSELLIPIETHGGPEWPLIQSERVGEETNVWSNQGAGVSTTKAKRAEEGAIMLVTLMDKNAHISNTEVANAIIGTNVAYVKDKRIPEKNLKLLNKKIKSEDSFKDFVGIDSPDINDYIAKLPFQGEKSRARLATILSSKDAESLGAANVQRILDEMRSPAFEGGRIGDSVIALQLSKGAPVVKLSESGGMVHPSYQYAVRGKVIGKFARPINAEMIYDDFLAKRRAEGKPTSGDRRAIDLAKPVQIITKEIANRIPQTPYKYLRSSQHAKILKYALENDWKDSATAKNKGGISPAEFIDTLNSSEAKVALNDYTLDSIKKEIKDGKLNLYQLGDSKVFFGTKNSDPASDYGLDPKDYGFGENEKTLTLVLNAERGTAGMGDAIMMKALSEGVTALDCFAIKNSRYPDGMLPSLYKRFGFEVVGEIPFDPQYYTPQKLADIKLFWKNNGWDESAGLPSVVMMKWKGNENDRTRSLRDIAGENPTSFRERATPYVGDARSDSERTDRGQGRSPQGRLQQGESGRGGGSAGDAVQGIQLGRGTINAIQELLGMNDSELKNLGIDPAQIKAIKKTVGMSQ